MRFVGIILLLIAPALAAQSRDERNPERKQPWEWTLEERIAERCNRALAEKRVAAAAQIGSVHKGREKTKDVIDGKLTPQLFLAVELFEPIVAHGILDKGWRETMEEKVVLSGLPPDFYERLKVIAALYMHDLAEERYLLQEVAPVDRDGAYRRLATLRPTLCRDRADALLAARAEFGPALDLFMYRYVAPTRTIFLSDHIEPAHLRAKAEGCR